MVEKTEEKKFMKAIIYTAPGQFEYSATTKTIPTPGKGEVLIKVECCPIIPSDTYYLAGKYSGNFSYPVVPGSEGSGTVIASGGGFMAWTLVGKRVAFGKQVERAGNFAKDGTYAEYSVTSAMHCIPIEAHQTFEQGCNGTLNPLTAIGLVEKARTYGVNAIVQTGAFSQVGRMVIRLCREQNIPIVNIVRKAEQVEILKSKYEQKYALNSEDADFQQQLNQHCKELRVNVAFECVSGPVVAKILDAIKPNSVIISYGALSEEKISGLNPLKLMGNNVRLEGFLLPYWVKEKSIWGQLSVIKQSKHLLEDVEVGKVYGFHQINEALEDYKNNMS